MSSKTDTSNIAGLHRPLRRAMAADRPDLGSALRTLGLPLLDGTTAQVDGLTVAAVRELSPAALVETLRIADDRRAQR
ncbi:hypothetical protein [Plantactinospora sp. KLBMP9567]|uniref:hypothetical protein n=1 Tax=Plantactinospora sp. KLBMP9567 TaxID=3085900 RepID=UPI002981FBE5|nr:hypothetical protein [Plantactinospora sp. KLBMP9567]MDW5327011.1 hypothetical protein [Plantactinospora sp. KLBMP9567]